jgi:hypothetical protein
MTEAEWLECMDPMPMLEFLRGKASDRKLRLCAVACCRRAWDSMPDARSKKAVETAEDYADGRATDDELNAASVGALSAAQVNITEADAHAEDWRKRYNALFAPWAVVQATVRDGPDGIGHGVAAILVAKDAVKAIGPPENEVQTQLVRDIFGNPFRPLTIDPSWLTPTVKILAQRIYTDRSFDKMPILADALKKAGCANEEILGHCRGLGSHVRGCWALDLVLGMG